MATPKFKLTTQATEQEVANFLTGLTPMKEYQIDAGHSFNFETQDTIPVDGSNDQLRLYSPFSFEVVPPLIYGDQLFSSTKKTGIVNRYYDAHLDVANDLQTVLGRRREQTQNTTLPFNAKSRQQLERFVASGFKYTTKNYKGIKSPAFADLRNAVDVLLQLQKLVALKPVVLLVNPQNMSISYNKIHQYSEKTGVGYVYQAWGEEIPKISIQGKTGGFVSKGATSGQSLFLPEGDLPYSTGYRYTSKGDSAAWQNLMKLFLLYLNGGSVYNRFLGNAAPQIVGSLAIRYDGNVFVGHMMSFSFSYDETKPYGGLDFNMEFHASHQYDVSRTRSLVQRMNTRTRSSRGREPSLARSQPPQVQVGSGFRFTPDNAEAELTQQLQQVSQSAQDIQTGSQGFVTPDEGSQLVTVTVNRKKVPFKGLKGSF
jgi:hypothetical protein